jgi:tRNA(fMet)-specific endonuclease VapC
MGREDRVAQFEASMDVTEVLSLDDAAARLAGRINADLERAGRIIGMPDVMVAAIALRGRVPVVTGNVAHFEQVRATGYELAIENWRAGCLLRSEYGDGTTVDFLVERPHELSSR